LADPKPTGIGVAMQCLRIDALLHAALRSSPRAAFFFPL
jgi:hypothetical protein